MSESTAQIEDRMLAALRVIRGCWPALMVETVSATNGGQSSDEVTPLDRKISLRYDVHLCLNGWARVVMEDRPVTKALPDGRDTIGLVDFLTRHAQWFSGHEAGQDATDELAGWAAKVRGAAMPQRREWMPIGTCPLDVDSPDGPVTCGGQVRAYPGKDPACHSCGVEAVVEWWERVMFPDVETSTLVTATDLVTVLHKAFGGSPVKPSTIRQWIKRGVIAASGSDEKGRTLYDRAAVVYAVARRVERG